MDTRKLAAAYIFLVGAPLLALVGILRAGSHLTAPMALHGNWSVQADFSPWRGVPCGALLTQVQQPLFHIDQSGSDLTLTFNDPEKTVLLGTIDGFALSTTLPTGRGEAEPAARPDTGCLGSQSLRIKATANKHEEQRSLAGTFSLNGCTSCPPIAFSATRQMPTGRSQQ